MSRTHFSPSSISRESQQQKSVCENRNSLRSKSRRAGDRSNKRSTGAISRSFEAPHNSLQPESSRDHLSTHTRKQITETPSCRSPIEHVSQDRDDRIPERQDILIGASSRFHPFSHARSNQSPEPSKCLCSSVRSMHVWVETELGRADGGEGKKSR